MQREGRRRCPDEPLATHHAHHGADVPGQESSGTADLGLDSAGSGFLAEHAVA